MHSMEEIYEQHTKTVYSFLLSKTGDPNLAEELTQETFYQAIKGISKSSVSTWLCAIAQNVWKKYLEKNKKEMLVGASDYQPEEKTAYSPEEIVLAEWDKIEILKMLHRLDEPMREVMYLRLVANLSFKEIGEIMERTEVWARVNYYRGKEKIIKEVKRC